MPYPFHVKDVFHTKSKQIRLGSSLSLVILKSYFVLITILFRNKAKITCPINIQGPPPTQLKLTIFYVLYNSITFDYPVYVSPSYFTPNIPSERGIKEWGIYKA